MVCCLSGLLKTSKCLLSVLKNKTPCQFILKGPGSAKVTRAKTVRRPCLVFRLKIDLFYLELMYIFHWNAIGVFANCADIFKMTPTDEGMCCSFNMPAAEEIYINSEYTRIIAELQNISRGKHLQPGGGGLPMTP